MIFVIKYASELIKVITLHELIVFLRTIMALIFCYMRFPWILKNFPMIFCKMYLL